MFGPQWTLFLDHQAFLWETEAVFLQLGWPWGSLGSWGAAARLGSVDTS